MTDALAGATRPLLLAVDQGTSSTKALLIGSDGAVTAQVTVPVTVAHPRPGWVEQDAQEIFTSVRTAIQLCLTQADGTVIGVGLSTQRESTLIWDRVTGAPLGPLLGWQDRRTTGTANMMTNAGQATLIREITGLPLDPMFSALKLAWLLDEVDPDRSKAKNGQIAVGTVDSWLMFNLTGEHRIETGNASRTQLLGIDKAAWHEDLLEIFGIPTATLPQVLASNHISDPIRGIDGLAGVPVYSVLADSHAALFAHGVRDSGAVKATYGSGSSVMGLIDRDASVSDGLVRTIAWDLGTPVLGFEGNILSSGSTLTWLAGILQVDHAELATLARSVDSSNGVNLIPAFAGLGAPWWDDRAEALISGLALGTGRDSLARAGFESIALQIEDVLAAADVSTGTPIEKVLVDGGPSANDWLVQLQADLSQRRVERSEVAELSASGAAHMAGVGAGMWSAEEVLALPRARTVFEPQIDSTTADNRRTSWSQALGRARYRNPSAVS